ncbi:uncharacterized protein LOC123535821 [Mercenaria mercenaria]|uniref:uncharacterized protein LOC123535821 n=1 Tax=Mercenaria mercenaria TaxID=6596 RepID=UPI00234E4DEC|nr:uncharacterized protein LOC123535821 [Mercenaria mercenaria]
MGRRKRTKSQASPNFLFEQPGKRLTMSNQSPVATSPNGNFIAQVPGYQGQFLPPHTQFMTPPQYQQQCTQSSMPTMPINQAIMEKLEAMDKRLNKLDIIESQISNLTQKMTVIDQRVSSLESKVHEQNSKLTEFEVSRNFDSQSNDEIRKKQCDIDKQVKSGLESNKKVMSECESLKQETHRLSEEVIDLQSRSMRDNLLFFNFDEDISAEARKNEDCCSKIYTFCKNDLGMADAQTRIQIDRAHRIGKFTPGKKRPIVAKFNHTPDKIEVKQKVLERKDAISIRCSDQYPKVIQDRRKKLIPELIKARDENKEAVLRYDKLYINGSLFRETPLGDI